MDILLEKLKEKIIEDPRRETKKDYELPLPTKSEIEDNAEMSNDDYTNDEETEENTPEEENVEYDPFDVEEDPRSVFDYLKVDKEIESIEVAEKHKRIRLLNNFKELLSVTEKLDLIVKDLVEDEFTKTQKNILNNISKMLDKTKEKIQYYINNNFVETTYEKLLYTYVWLRSEVYTLSNILKSGLKLE